MGAARAPIFIMEKYRFQVLVEAFNLINHRNGLQIASVAYAYVAPGTPPASGFNNVCPVGSHVNTCIAPYTATTSTTTPFGVINSTSSVLYGARQLQFAAKLFF
jgi:hypothetical protein